MAKPIRICMVGAGRVGKNHSKAITRHVPGGHVVALVDPAVEVRDQTGDQFGIDARFGDLEEPIDKIAFDAVVITTPTFTLKPLALLAAGHGKHVFCEKPMAMMLAECDEMISATRRARGHSSKSDPSTCGKSWRPNRSRMEGRPRLRVGNKDSRCLHMFIMAPRT